ncbi:MAG: NAD(P)-dependent oxidoreductase, partial [Pseudomonadales bacterium]|nr:NAD(P)-dependent oxidoreductase [Pseudomonadales bacterium]
TPAKRPTNSVLDAAKILAAFTVPRRPWQDGLEDVLEILLAETE